MTRQELWDLLQGPDSGRTLYEELLATPFDEELEIDLSADRYRYVYHVAEKYRRGPSGSSFHELITAMLEEYVHPEDAEAYRAMTEPATLAERLKAGKTPGVLRGDFRIRGLDGGWIATRQLFISGQKLGQEGSIVHCFVYDRHRQWENARYALSHDATQSRPEEVTGLADSVAFFRAAQRIIEEGADGLCLTYIRLRHYRLFTDWYGLDSGRFILTRMGEILRKEAENAGGLAGYPGEENFCLLVPYDRERIKQLFDRLWGTIRAVSDIDGFQPAFGISMIDGSCGDIREYYNHAALTADEIERDQHTLIRVYDTGIHQKNQDEYRILRAFGLALERGDIQFWVQPQCSLPDRRIVGAEALARWQMEDGSYLSPAVFVPVLEKYGAVTELDEYIWESVCKWQRSWIRRGHTPLPISVNISRIDLFTIDVPGALERLTRKYGLEPKYLKVEITESAYVKDAEGIRKTVGRLREMGFMVLMDDFGSGYSSLNMLKDLNMDVIKLDAQFLQIESQRRKGVSILESVVNMTRNLGTPIIVEGVETASQLAYLSDLGCRYVQGFYFYQPMPVTAFEAAIENEDNIDTDGFLFKANQQLRIREFMDENIYSDVMLNNILGPVAFYSWHGEDVDIVRYNEQFFELVGIELADFRERMLSIQTYIHMEDREKFFHILREAKDNPLVGAKGVVRTYRPNGVLVAIALHVYYSGEDASGTRFYASARDVTDLEFVSAELPGGYYRCTMDDSLHFLFVSESFLKMTGYSEQEIHTLFGNSLIRMLHPADTEQVRRECAALIRRESSTFHPYRIRRRDGTMMYVADQSRITDHYGPPCWESIIIDISEVMHRRNQIQVLSEFMNDSILLLCDAGNGNLKYEVAIHGLQKRLGFEAEEFENLLNSGGFCRWIEGCRDIPHQEYTRMFIASVLEAQRTLRVHLPDGRTVRLLAWADRVGDDSAIQYIVHLRMLE